MSLIRTSDYSTWLTKLNTIRTKHSLSQVSAPTPAVTSGSLIKRSQIVHLRNKIHETYNTVTRLRQISINIRGDFNVGKAIMGTTKSDLDNELSRLDSICAIDPCIVNGVCSTNGYDSQCITTSNTTNATFGNYSQCSTYYRYSASLPISEGYPLSNKPVFEDYSSIMPLAAYNNCSDMHNNTCTGDTCSLCWNMTDNTTNSTCSTNSTYGNYSDNSTNSTNGDYSDNSTNTTNSNYSNCTTNSTVYNTTNSNNSNCITTHNSTCSTYSVNTNTLPIESL